MLAIAAIAFALGGTAVSSVETLPACRAASVSIPEAWKTIGAQGRVQFRIPPDMQETHDPKLGCVHGCEAWSRGTFRVVVAHGIWGVGSFDDEWLARACAETRGTLRVVLMPSEEGKKHVVVVWPVNDTSTQSTNDILLNVQWTDPTDEADAKKVIASLTAKR
ncbi:MAG TPA: hypothetical protein VGJ82_20265 [Thermoanaerobaculia bacterium]